MSAPTLRPPAGSGPDLRPTRLLRLIAWRVRVEVLEWSGTWWFLLTLVVQAVLGPLIGMFVWSAVYPHDPYVATYYVALILVTVMTESFEQFTFSEKLYDGTISHDLLRPQPVVVNVIGTNIAIRAWLTVMGVPLVLLTGFAFGVALTWTSILEAVPVFVLGAALSFSWTFLLSLTAFWTERVHSIVGFGWTLNSLLGGTVAPLAFLPEPWRGIGEVLPFYGMLGLPADVASGRVHGLAPLLTGLGYQAVWIVVIITAVVVLWRAGIRRYTVVGA
ncbi:ABC-2 family transporter protein [Actinopolymorpha rutila]|uniref:ABC-2 type transport system permease protein n=1 Tax=Actinopolymorpha rutila TaxID=446787 RepID=A0A852ZAA6_9ACTN|nr:ABC-2 family transporter protein [Actinopolymorpha rutila]NYH89145.1 ABC-2 type transport system permease protein [Actinopolymorpha rutila]